MLHLSERGDNGLLPALISAGWLIGGPRRARLRRVSFFSFLSPEKVNDSVSPLHNLSVVKWYISFTLKYVSVSWRASYIYRWNCRKEVYICSHTKFCHACQRLGLIILGQQLWIYHLWTWVLLFFLFFKAAWISGKRLSLWDYDFLGGFWLNLRTPHTWKQPDFFWGGGVV